MNYIEQLGVNAKAAKGEIATCSTAKKNNALMEIAKQLRECCGEILEANSIDLNNAKNAGMSVSMQDRLALDEADSAAGADFVAVVRQAALAAFSHVVTVGGASVTGVADDVHQGGIIVLFGNGALIDTVGQTGVLGNRAQRQAHSQTQALADNGALQEDGLTILGQLAGSDLVGQVLDTRVVAALIGQTSDLGEDLLAVCGHGSCDTAGLSEIHSNSPLSITIFCVYFNTYLA